MFTLLMPVHSLFLSLGKVCYHGKVRVCECTFVHVRAHVSVPECGSTYMRVYL